MSTLEWAYKVPLISKVRKPVGMLGRLRRSLTTESANTVSCSLIRPTLEYCVSVWGCCGEGNKQGLETLQNQAVRISCKNATQQSHIGHLIWPTLDQQRQNFIFNLINWCLKSQCPEYFKHYFKRNNVICACASRQNNFLHLPAVRTKVAKRSFYCYGCKVFNDLSF